MRHLKVVLSAFTLWTLFLNSVPVNAQGSEMVSSDDISGGSSVFVFRKSKSAPQVKAATRNVAKRNPAAKAKSRQDIRAAVAKAPPIRKKTPPKAVVTTPTPTPGKPKPKSTPIPNNTASKEKASTDFAGGAETFLDKGEVNKAIGLFRESVKLNPKNEAAKAGLSDALTRKADSVFETDGAESALPIYKEASELDKTNSVAFAGLGSAYDELKNVELAFQNYNQALTLNANLTELYAPLGVAYYQKGDIPKADEFLSKAVAIKAEDDQTQYFLGIIRYNQQKYNEAIGAFNNSLKIRDSAEAHYYLGEVFDKLDRQKEAIDEYNQATKLNPNYTEAWFDLGAAYYNNKRYEDAINAYGQAIRLKNDNYEAHENLADIYRQLAFNTKDTSNNKQEIAKNLEYRKVNYGKAEGEYQLAVTLAEMDLKDPKKKMDSQTVADLYGKYGFVLGRLLKWDSTISTLNKAVSISPDSLDYTNLGWAYYNSAQVDLYNKKLADRNSDSTLASQKEASAKVKLEQGRNALQKASTMDPKAVGAFMNLGVTLTDLGDYKGSIEALKKCVSLRDKWIPALNELGIAFRKDGNIGEAIDSFKRAVDVDKNFAPGLFNWAEAEFARGNLKEARKIQDRLKKINPNLANGLESIFLNTPANQLKQKVEQKNPLNKIPKIPKIPY